MKKIMVIAVGGAGTSIVKHAFNAGMKVPALVIDYDDSMVTILGLSNVDFLKFEERSQSFMNNIEAKIKDFEMIVIVGGASGELASKCISQVGYISKKYTEDVICFVSCPFDFEGSERIALATKVQKEISSLGIKLYIASLQQILDLGFYKTQKQMFEAIGHEFLEILKEEIRG